MLLILIIRKKLFRHAPPRAAAPGFTCPGGSTCIGCWAQAAIKEWVIEIGEGGHLFHSRKIGGACCSVVSRLFMLQKPSDGLQWETPHKPLGQRSSPDLPPTDAEPPHPPRPPPGHSKGTHQDSSKTIHSYSLKGEGARAAAVLFSSLVLSFSGRNHELSPLSGRYQRFCARALSGANQRAPFTCAALPADR
ncbi:hypothetical protein Q8A73_009490 [Channa argus]|nr:hypothetical protein Q8A73_009490 [Channa argus]